MARSRIQYRCSQCDRLEPKWLGQCPQCGAWNSLEEEAAAPHGSAARARPAGALAGPIPVARIPVREQPWQTTGLAEIDRVLGGGLLPGAVILIGGEPGIGKSTLLLQVCAGAARSGRPALYVTGEEAGEQVRARASRLGLDLEGLHLLAGTDCTAAIEALGTGSWSLVVIDSVQALRLPELPSAAGSVSQVREVSARLAEAAKAAGVALCLIGHVTKEGTLAGPRTLEHLVDTVLYFEADPNRTLRVVRAHKNRFGPVSEIGVFEMTASGLSEVVNPSAAFLADRPTASSGSVVCCSLRGSRPILVEVQALVNPTPAAMPRRTALGFDPNRVALLAAVLERRAEVQLTGCDLFVNVVGGLNLDEPAADLAVCLALLSSLTDRPVPSGLVVFGEVGLAGEVRTVPSVRARIEEAVRLGFDSLLLPAGNLERIESDARIMLRPLASIARLAELALQVP